MFKIGRNISAAGAWSAPPTDTQPGAGYKIIRLPSGPAGAPAKTVFQFGWPGLGISGEPPTPYTESAAWSLSASNTTGSAENGPAADATYVLYGDLGSGFVVVATAVFRAADSYPWAPHITVNIASGPAGTKFKMQPPATADVSLFGANITWSG